MEAPGLPACEDMGVRGLLAATGKSWFLVACIISLQIGFPAFMFSIQMHRIQKRNFN